MAVKISDLSVITTATDDDYYPMVDPGSGQTRRITKADLLKELRSGTDLAAQAVKADKADFSVADETARDVFTPFDGLMVYRKDLECIEVYDGSAWRTFGDFEILKKITLGSNGDTISTGTFAARKYLRVYFQLWGTGGTLTPAFRFNNDTGANYAASYSANFAAPAVSVSQISLGVTAAVSPAFQQGIWDIANIATRRKIVRGTSSDDNDASATTGSNNVNLAGKWDNSANAITRIDLVNLSGTGDFVAGAQMVVLGRD